MRYKCDNCGAIHPHVDVPLNVCSNLHARLEPGSTVPDGECLDCGAFVYRHGTAGGGNVPGSRNRVIELGVFDIIVELNGKGGTIKSNLVDSDVEADSHKYAAAVDGIEALLLSLACAGIDLTTPAVRGAVETAIEAIANQYT